MDKLRAVDPALAQPQQQTLGDLMDELAAAHILAKMRAPHSRIVFPHIPPGSMRMWPTWSRGAKLWEEAVAATAVAKRGTKH